METDEAGDPAVSDPTQESADWRQADHFDVDQIAVTAEDGGPGVLATPSGVAIVSQSCDVVLPHRPSVQVAPITQLGETEAAAARDGKRSQFVHLPVLGDTMFVDLDNVSTIAKTALAGRWLSRGVDGDMAIRRFSAAVARRFGRFAFPDDVSDAMKALRDLVQSKSGNPASPFGAILGKLVELRAESPRWSDIPCEVTLVLIPRPGVMPTLPDDGPEAVTQRVASLRATESNGRTRLTDISVAIGDTAKGWTASELTWLWIYLAEAAAFSCSSRARTQYDKAADDLGLTDDERDYSKLPTFAGDVVPADEYPLTRVRQSEIVDLDHLSDPPPLDNPSD